MLSHSRNRQPKGSNMPAWCVWKELHPPPPPSPHVHSLPSQHFLTGASNGCTCGFQLVPCIARRPPLEEAAPWGSDYGHSRVFHLHAGEVWNAWLSSRWPASFLEWSVSFRTLFWRANSRPPRASQGEGDHRFCLLQVTNHKVFPCRLWVDKCWCQLLHSGHAKHAGCHLSTRVHTAENCTHGHFHARIKICLIWRWVYDLLGSPVRSDVTRRCRFMG